MSKKKDEQKQETVETKELQVKEEAPLALAPETDMNAWGQSPVSAQDIIIPRIFLMQPMSDMVTEGNAAFGEFRESLSNELLGKFEEGFEFVPFLMKKVFVEFDVSDSKNPEYLRTVQITPANDQLPYEDSEVNEEGKKIPISRDRTLLFYGLLAKELDAGVAMPYIVSARRSSIKGGKKIATQMYVKNMAMGKTPAATVMKVFARKESNDKGTFAVLDASPVRPSKPEYVAEAFKWMNMIQAGKVKEDAAQDEYAGATSGATEATRDVGTAQF